MDTQVFKDLLIETEDKCIEAVEHVGAANYPEREREALGWVRKEFQKLHKACNSFDDLLAACELGLTMANDCLYQHPGDEVIQVKIREIEAAIAKAKEGV